MKVALMIAAVLALAPAVDLKLGEAVPDVALGKESLAALSKEGRIVAVYFWSATCPFGPPNYPNLKAATDKFAGNDKVRIFVVSSSGDPEAQGQAWAKESGLKGTFVFDEDRKIAKHFAPRKVNATFVIDAKGNLAYRGGIATDKTNLLIDAINALLEGKVLPASDQKFDGCGIRP
jgi:peroxiredoxin